MEPDPEPHCTLCDLCGMEVEGKDAMRKHKATVHKPLPVPVACPQCGKIFKQKVSMQAHLQHAHLNPQDVKPWECMFCSFACKRKSNLRQHLRVKHKMTTKEACDKVAEIDIHALQARFPGIYLTY